MDKIATHINHMCCAREKNSREVGNAGATCIGLYVKSILVMMPQMIRINHPNDYHSEFN